MLTSGYLSPFLRPKRNGVDEVVILGVAVIAENQLERECRRVVVYVVQQDAHDGHPPANDIFVRHEPSEGNRSNRLSSGLRRL